MLLALAPILTTLFASGSLASGLAAIGATQWIALGETILAATPQETMPSSRLAAHCEKPVGPPPWSRAPEAKSSSSSTSTPRTG